MKPPMKPNGHVGVFVPLGFRDDLLDDHVNHGPSGKRQGVRQNRLHGQDRHRPDDPRDRLHDG